MNRESPIAPAEHTRGELSLPEPVGQRLPQSSRSILIATFWVGLVQMLVRPASLWEHHDFQFAMGVVDFEPLIHHPHPPGYPLYIGLGKAFALLAPDPFHALTALSIVASTLLFTVLAIAFSEILYDSRYGISGALVFHFSPAMLVHSSLPMSDPAALLFLGLALLLASRVGQDREGRWLAILFGLSSSAAIGCRPQLALPLLPLFFFTLWKLRSGRGRVEALLSFTALGLAWISPLVWETGGIIEFIRYQGTQATYVLLHDSSKSRFGESILGVLPRFALHPWGPGAIALPVLMLGAVGAFWLLRERARAFLPFLLFGILHIGFCVVTMDPADGVRYALPALITVALAVGGALAMVGKVLRTKLAPTSLCSLFVLASAWYTWPLISARAKSPSPPAQAAAFADATLPAHSVVLYDLSLHPHADFLLRRFRPMKIDDGLCAFADAGARVPLYILGDAASNVEGAVTFEWRGSDAYIRLTRNFYRKVSLYPLIPERRFIPIRGIDPIERDATGEEWRWVRTSAALLVPVYFGQSVTLEFLGPVSGPHPFTPVSIRSGPNSVTQVILRKGKKLETTVRLEPGVREISFLSGVSFVPDEIVGNGDTRALAFQLLGLRAAASSDGAKSRLQ